MKHDATTKNYIDSIVLEKLVIDFFNKRCHVVDKEVEFFKLIDSNLLNIT